MPNEVGRSALQGERHLRDAGGAPVVQVQYVRLPPRHQQELQGSLQNNTPGLEPWHKILSGAQGSDQAVNLYAQSPGNIYQGCKKGAQDSAARLVEEVKAQRVVGAPVHGADREEAVGGLDEEAAQALDHAAGHPHVRAAKVELGLQPRRAQQRRRQEEVVPASMQPSTSQAPIYEAWTGPEPSYAQPVQDPL